MSKKDLLIEIGLEELPARFVTDAIAQLETKVQKIIKINAITV